MWRPPFCARGGCIDAVERCLRYPRLVQCYACDLEAVAECPRCGVLFCGDHGEALCVRCMDPNLALPSYRIYRGSLLALLVGSVFAVWLLVLSPDNADSDGPSGSLAEVLPRATATLVPLVKSTSTPVSAAVVPTPLVARATPEPTPEPTPGPTATSGVAEEYIVQPGDSMTAIVERFIAPGGDEEAFLDRIVEFNEIVDPSSITIGQVIKIPTQ